MIIVQPDFAEGKGRLGKAQSPKMAPIFSLSLGLPLSLQLQGPLVTNCSTWTLEYVLRLEGTLAKVSG